MENYPFNTPRKPTLHLEIEEPYPDQRSQDYQRNLLLFGSPISPEEVLRISNDNNRQPQQLHHPLHQHNNRDIRVQNTNEYAAASLLYDRFVPRITDPNQIPFINLVNQNHEDKVLHFSRNLADQRNNKGVPQQDQEWLERKEMLFYQQQHFKDQKRLQPNAKHHPQISLQSSELINKKALNIVDINDSGVLSIGVYQTILLYNLQTKYSQRLSVCPIETWQSNYVSALSWCPGKQNVLGVGDNQGILSIWDAVKEEAIQDCFQCLSRRINVLSWNTPNLLTATDSLGIIYNMDIRGRGLIAQQFSSPNKEAIRSFKWNQQNTSLVGCFKGQVAIWNVFKDQTPVRTIKCSNSSKVNSVTWSGLKKEHFLTGGDSKDASLKLWDSVSGRNLDSFVQPSKSSQSQQPDNFEILHVFASHNNFPGYYAATSNSANNEFTIWQEQANMKLKKKYSLQNSRTPLIYGNISTTKESILTASNDGFIKVWDCFELGRSNSLIQKTKSLLDEGTSCVR